VTTPPVSSRLGARLFRWRSLTPLPIIAVGIVLGRPSLDSILLGAALTALGEFIRGWAVAHIGTRSRTRGGGVGPLVTSGPFARCRNPIYLGNLAVGAGIVWATGVPLLLPAYVALFAVQYGLIVAWEEEQLEAAHGPAFDTYRIRVPRWLPTRGASPFGPSPFGPSTVLRSERSTLVGQVLAYGVLIALMVVRG
jgi:protein-S-isoprenylcysteine O-methyltransferase Ste14